MSLNRFALMLGVLLLLVPCAQAEPIGHWTFDEFSGDMAVDGVNANNAVIGDASNVVWSTNGIIGGCAYLTGDLSEDGAFKIDAIPEMAGATNLTVSAWFRVPEGTIPGDPYKGVVMTRDLLPDSASGYHRNWGIAYYGNKECAESRVGTWARSPDNSVERDTWHHSVMTWDADGKELRFYLDGVLYEADNADMIDAYTIIDSGSWFIGCDPVYTNRVFRGDIDDVSIWDEAMEPAEVEELFAKGLMGLAATDWYDIHPPFIIFQPTNAVRVLGDIDDEPSFSLQAVHVIDYGYHWYVNGIEDWFAYEATYQDRDTPIYDAREYYCVLEGEGNTMVTSDTVTVTQYLPEINEGLQSVYPGESAAMSITMPDNGEVFEYQWMKDGTNLVGEVGSQLLVEFALENDRGAYSVRVTWRGVTLTSEEVILDVSVLGGGMLIGYWPFDETNGTVAADHTFFGNDAVWNNENGEGLTWTGDAGGWIGGSASLSGTNSTHFFEVPHRFDLDAITMACWVYGKRSAGMGIMGHRAVDNGSQWGITVGGYTEKQFDFRFSSMACRSVPYETNQWYHLAMVWDKETGERSTYVNGTMIFSDNQGADLVYNTDRRLLFGDDSCCDDREFGGLFDEFAIWGRALSAYEIELYYSAGKYGHQVPTALIHTCPPHASMRLSVIERVLGGQADVDEITPFIHGAYPILLQWQHDGVALPGETNETLTVAGRASGEYTLLLTNFVASATSDVAVISDILPPVDPEIRSIIVGQEQLFEMALPEEQTYAYQWLKDDAAISGAVAATCSIPNAQLTDSGSYAVDVTLGTTTLRSDAAVLIVHELAPIGRGAVAGGQVTLTWPSDAADPGYAIEATTNLVEGVWIPVQQAIVPTPPANSVDINFGAEAFQAYRIIKTTP